MQRNSRLLLLLLIAGLSAEIQADLLTVPTDFPTIQSALNVSTDGDTVLALPGQYSESLVIPEVSIVLGGEFLLTHDSTSIAETVIRPAGNPPAGRCIFINNSVRSVIMRISGLTLRGSVSNAQRESGGIYVEGHTLLLDYCLIDSAYAGTGGAIGMRNGFLFVTHCTFSRVGSTVHGAVLFLQATPASISNSSVGLTFTAAQQSTDQIYTSGGTIILSDSRFTDMGFPESAGTQFVYAHDVRSFIEISNCEFVRNRFQNLFASDLFQNQNPPHIEFDSNLVSDNEFFIGGFATTNFDSGTVAYFRHNRFIANTGLSNPSYSCRLFFNISRTNCNVEITDNLFFGNTGNEFSVASLIDTDSLHTRFTNNYIVNNSTHDALGNPPGGAVVMIGVPPGVFRNNVMVGNQPYAAFKGLLSFPTTNARNCSWGHETGPHDTDENPAGLGDSVGDSVWVTPWYYDSSYVSVPNQPTAIIADNFIFGNAYPNPFNDAVTFEFAVLRDAEVRLAIYDVSGRLVATLLDDERRIGVHTVSWQPQQTASGVYFARLIMGQETAMKKVLYLK